MIEVNLTDVFWLVVAFLALVYFLPLAIAAILHKIFRLP